MAQPNDVLLARAIHRKVKMLHTRLVRSLPRHADDIDRYNELVNVTWVIQSIERALAGSVIPDLHKE